MFGTVPHGGDASEASSLMAHLRPIERPRCRRCGKRATQRLYNRFNGPVGEFCGKCAATELRDMERRERAPVPAES